ncbi:RCC1 domain-containing protein [Pandoraea anhela]|uniref:Uncharacterized protein n=1 Tax=Pandoraea anhela TaxID=2508295 RepID=A0A5E4T6V2_9BURK|nr:hypothetical protein [Pandoraea anhela]VVD83565.1 hypothetical protein PAN31108_01238 [Pandoraea anhela]
MAEQDIGLGGLAIGNLVAPQANDAANGAIDPAKLGTRGASFTIPVYPGMAADDYVEFFFDDGSGNTLMGDADVSTNTAGKPLPIWVTKANLSAYLDKTVKVTYTVNPGDGSAPVTSPPLSLYIGVKKETKLKAPTVDEAVGDHLESEFVDFGVRARIPIYDGMAIGDMVNLAVGKSGDAGFYQDSIKVRAVRAVTFSIPPEALASFDDKTMPVSYNVVRGAQTFSSETFKMRIGDAQEEGLLEMPAMADAIGGVLNPTLLGAATTALIGPYTGLESGDYVHVVWGGGPPKGFETTEQISSRYLTEPFPVRIPADKIAAFTDSTTDLYYEKEMPDGSWQKSQSLKVQVSQASATADPPSVPLSSAGQLDTRDLDPLKGAEVIVPPYAGMRAGDTIVLKWDNEDDTGDYTSPAYLVKPADVPNPLSFQVPYLLATRGGEKSVVTSYEVQRGGATIVKSGEQKLLVRQVLPTAVTITEAKEDEINPDDCRTGAHVQLPSSAKFRANDKVTFHWEGEGGAGNYTTTVTVSPEQAGGALEIVVPQATLKAGVNHSASVGYTITRANGTPDETAPPSIFDVIAVPSSGMLRVFGARNNSAIYRSSSVPQYLSVFHLVSGEPIKAQWRYEDETDWVLGHRFKDTRPWMPLKVRTQDDSATFNPVNIAGNGPDTTTRGTSSLIALLNRGSVAGFGASGSGGVVPSTLLTIDDVVETSSTSAAYALRRANGRITAWGSSGTGGVLPENLNVTDAVRIVGNGWNFAVLRANGQVMTWGPTPTAGVPVPAPIATLNDIKSVWASGHAFAALRKTGQVVAWGTATTAGAVPKDIGDLIDIVDVRGNYTAFAALRKNHTVVAWGADGGVVPSAIASRGDIMELASASARAFAVRTLGNQVLAWGLATHGGTVPQEISDMSDLLEIVATWGAFCGLRGNGHVVAWGNANQGGAVPAPIAMLDDIVHVCGTGAAFAALRKDGTVVAWGDAQVGGDITSVKGQLVDIAALHANSEVFVAVKRTGGVVTWGVPASGGDSTSVKALLDTNLTYRATSESRGRVLSGLYA